MNFKQTTVIAILTISMGLFGVKSANAKNPLTETPATAHSNHIAQLTNAVNPLYGSWKLRYSVDGIVYESVLVMKGFSGSMTTRYYDPTKGKQAVDQTMYLKNSPDGLVLLGYNPVYAGTTIKHPYTADNFRFAIEPDGSKRFTVCDDAGRYSAVTAQSIR